MSIPVPIGPTDEPIEVLIPGEIYVIRDDNMMIHTIDMFVHALPKNFRTIKALTEDTFEYVPYVPMKMTDARQSQGVAPSVDRIDPGRAPSAVAEELTGGSVRPAKAADALLDEITEAMGGSLAEMSKVKPKPAARSK